MKVIVYFNSMSAAGGIERVISSHIDYLSEGCEVTLLTKDDGTSFYKLPSNIKRESLLINFNMNMRCRVCRVVKVAATLFRTVLSLRSQILKIRPDVIYVASPLNLLEVFLAGMNFRRVVVTEHSAFLSYNNVYKFIISKLYPRVALLTVPTKADSAGYLERGIRNVYIPNPLPFKPVETSDLSTKIALCIGRLTADKRHELLLDIWNLSNIQSQGWKLLIIGKGECEFELRKKIDALGLSESVSIEQPVPNIQDKYKNASIFLLASRAEGFGLVLIEAMAFGVPCISFDCPSGPRDIIVDGSTGYLLKEGDVDGYVESLRRLAMDESLRTEFGMRALSSVSKFHKESVGVDFMSIFNKIFC